MIYLGMLHKIIIYLSIQNQPDQEFFNQFKALLKFDTTPELLPQYEIKSTVNSHSYIQLLDENNDDLLSYQFHNFALGNITSIQNNHNFKYQDKGDFVNAKNQYFDYPQAKLETILKIFKGKINEVDHFGINLPSTQISFDEFLGVCDVVGQNSYLTNYPEVDQWKFIERATKEEIDFKIENFKIFRNPKFELVWDEYTLMPILQIDMLTQYSRRELHQLLPDSFAFCFDELEKYFRSCYLQNPFGILIRLDFRYIDTPHINQYKKGTWLIKSGGRYGFIPIPLITTTYTSTENILSKGLAMSWRNYRWNKSNYHFSL
jgi:hypothetical protein